MRQCNKIISIFIVIVCTMPHCATSDTVGIFKRQKAYSLLSYDERDLVGDICLKIDSAKNKAYYINKLILLINTPFVDASYNLKQRQLSDLDESVDIAVAFKKQPANITDEEELLEKSFDLKVHYPRSGWPAYYLIDNQDPLNIFIKIKVNLIGDADVINKMKILEDQIEKHLSIPGFIVNLEWGSASGPDTFSVGTKHGEWATSANWAGDHTVLAHELMHLFGLSDEYNLISSHADNKHIPIYTRLEWFLFQMDIVEIPGAEDGIMSHSWKKPLHRHVCAAVGMGESCVSERLKEYNN